MEAQGMEEEKQGHRLSERMEEQPTPSPPSHPASRLFTLHLPLDSLSLTHLNPDSLSLSPYTVKSVLYESWTSLSGKKGQPGIIRPSQCNKFLKVSTSRKR